ncbi:MAG: sigma-70 family RNA polymerase sigma factor [Dyadobacter sp.]
MQTPINPDLKKITSENEEPRQDFVLWQDFKQGNGIAFEQIVDRFYPELLNYGVRLIRDKDFAQDCLQDFFVDLWARKERLDNVESVKAYLFLSYRRRLFREKERSVWYKFAVQLDDQLDFEGQFNIETYLIEHESRNENLLKLQKSLSKLSKRQREAIYLRFNQALDYEQIAKIMEINHQSAVNLVYEAIRLLRKNWLLGLYGLAMIFL